MSATTYDVSYPAYSRSSFPPSMAALNSSHLSPLFDVSPLLYPPTPMRDVSSSSTTFFPNDATQQQHQQPPRFTTTVAQHIQNEQFSSSSTSTTPSTATNPPSTGSHPNVISAFFSSLASTTAPHSPLSIHHPSASSASYFDYSDSASHNSNARSQHDPLSFTHQQQLLHHRMLQQQLQAKAAVAVPVSPMSVQSDMNSVGGSAQDLFPSDSASSLSSQSPQQLSSVSSMSTPPPLPSSSLPPPAHHSYSHTQPLMQPQPQSQAFAQPTAGLDSKKRKGVLSRKIACNVCHLAKTSCDGARPCSRCVRLLKTSQCVDRPSKMAKKASAASGATEGNDASGAGAATSNAATTGAVAPAPSADASSTHSNNPESNNRAAAEQQSISSTNQTRRSLSAVVEDVDIDDEHDSDRSQPHSHSGEEWCDAASDHSSFSSDDDDNDSLDSLHSPPSAPLSFEAHISRSLLRAHINWINKQHDDLTTNPTQRMDLREKLIYFTWIRHMMQPEDVEQIIHYSEVYHRNEHGILPEKQQGGLGPLKRPVTPPTFRRRHAPYVPCDGSVCNNFCPTARAWAASNPVVFTWHSSPEAAVVDSTHNSYAVLVCRNLQDPSEVESQTKKIVANTLVLREREKQRQRSEVAAVRGSTETVHISPIAEDGVPTAGTSSPLQPPSSSIQGAEPVDAFQSIDNIIHMCGLSPQDARRLQAAREEQREEAEGKQSFTTLALRLANIHPPNNSTMSTDLQPSTSSSVSSVPLPPSPPIEVALSVHVNPAFERLFGYSQAELRQHFIRDGGKALYQLTRRDDWEKLMELDQEATWGREQEYRTYAVIVNKWKGEVRVMVHTVYEMHNDGKFKQSTTSFIPLPEDKPSNEVRERTSRRQRSGGGGGGSERERSSRSRRKEARHGKGGRGGSSGDVGAKEKRRERDERKRS